MPLICLFSDLNLKKVASFTLFIRHQNINIIMLNMNNKKGASLGFYEINTKKWPHLILEK